MRCRRKMIRLLQFLAVLFLLRYVWRALQRLAGEAERRAVDGGSARERRMIYRGRMVQDPVCGVYIPERGALSVHRDGRVIHFCSEACREAYGRGEAQAS